MKRIWVSLAAVVVLSIAAIAPAAAQDTVTINMQEIDDSGQSGTADITSDGDQVTVSIEIDAGPDGEPQPVHIHEGNCRDLGDVAFPLEDVVDGVSESTADVSLSELIGGTDYAINVHQSEDQMDVYVACGTLPLIGGAADADDEDAAAEEDEEAAEDDDAAVDEEDDAVAEDDEDATADDDAVSEDDEDGVNGEDDEDVTEEEDDATADEEEVDDAEDLVPATGSDGMGAESAVVLMTLLSGAALGGGLLVRRRFSQA